MSAAPGDARGVTAAPEAAPVAALIAGDRRELIIADRLVAAGYRVRHYGCHPALAQRAGQPEAASAAAAIAGASLIHCTIPGPNALTGKLYTPYRDADFFLRAADLDGAAPGAVLFTGSAYEGLREAAAARGLRNVNLSDDEELMVSNSAAVAEGALAAIITASEVPLHRASVVVMGFGKQAISLCRRLHALGARVTVVARDGAQRARALEMGLEAVPTGADEPVIRACKFLVYTIPALLLTRERLAWVPPAALVCVLTAPPGGVDFAAAQELGVRLIWPRGLSDTAYRVTAEYQWQAMQRALARRLS